jgi:hypothetical protein
MYCTRLVQYSTIGVPHSIRFAANLIREMCENALASQYWFHVHVERLSLVVTLYLRLN